MWGGNADGTLGDGPAFDAAAPGADARVADVTFDNVAVLLKADQRLP